MYDSYVESKEKKRKDTSELIYMTEIDTLTQKANLGLPEVKNGGMNQKVGINIYTLLYTTWVINKDLLHSTGNYT